VRFSCAAFINSFDGLRGVLQMIAHGFVVVDYSLADIIYRRYETRTIDEMGGIHTSAKFVSMF
jgi:NADH-quinone oxidoreductase subunit M